jgi:probable rRNA maturation factor
MALPVHSDCQPLEAEPADPEPRPRLEVEVLIESELWNSLPGVEAAILRAAAALARYPALTPKLPASACIALADDRTVRSLNASYRGKDKATNVLSFPSHPAPHRPLHGAPAVGDVILAFETVMGEASAMDISAEHHVQHLTIHGLLHLFGFDHEKDEMAAEMEGIETVVLATLGVADPYARLPE